MKDKAKEIMETSLRHYCVWQNKTHETELQTTYNVLTELGLLTKDECYAMRDRIFEEYGK